MFHDRDYVNLGITVEGAEITRFSPDCCSLRPQQALVAESAERAASVCAGRDLSARHKIVQDATIWE